MKTRFLHIADIHLGYEQYGSAHRYNDFYHAFESAIDDALREAVDFVLIAGDLFHQRSIAPQTLLQAAHQLARLGSAGIPAIGVMGNHERPHYRDRESWLHYLSGRGLLTLLAPTYADGQIGYEPYGDGIGGYIDVGSTRVYGLPYSGSVTTRLLAETAQFFAASETLRPDFTILVTHAGLEGIIPHFGANMTYEELAALRPYVDYVALGHIHKPFEKDGWAFNPGSLEPVAISEADYCGGGYLVDVDTGRAQPIRTQHRRYAVRPFLRLRLSVSGLTTPQELYASVERHLASQRKTEGKRPVVEYVLEGVLPFDRASLDVSRVEAMLVAALNPIVPRVRNATLSADFGVAVTDDEIGRPELERQVLSELLSRDSRYRHHAARWADLVAGTKRLALEDASSETIIEHLREGRARIGVEE